MELGCFSFHICADRCKNYKNKIVGPRFLIRNIIIMLGKEIVFIMTLKALLVMLMEKYCSLCHLTVPIKIFFGLNTKLIFQHQSNLRHLV